MLKNSPYKFVTFLAFINIFFIGTTVFLLSSTKFNLMEAYGIGLAQIGLLITVRGLVNIVLPLIFGRLSDKIGRRPVIISGIVLFLLAYLSIPTFSDYHFLILTIMVIGIGFSLVDATSQAVLFDAHKDPTPLMPFMQVAFAFGALSAPLFVSVLLDLELDWRIAYHTYAVLIAVLLVLMLKAKFPPLAHENKKEEAAPTFEKKPAFRREGLTICAFIFFITIVNSVIGEWGDIYFRYVYDFSHVWSVRALSFFQMGCLLGALVNFWLTSKRNLHASKLLNYELVIALIAFCASLFFNSGVLAIALFVLIGMCIGTLFSLAIGIMGTLFRENSGVATGAMMSSASMAVALSSTIVGNLIGYVGIGSIFVVLAFVILAALIVSLIIKRQYNVLNTQ